MYQVFKHDTDGYWIFNSPTRGHAEDQIDIREFLQLCYIGEQEEFYTPYRGLEVFEVAEGQHFDLKLFIDGKAPTLHQYREKRRPSNFDFARDFSQRFWSFLRTSSFLNTDLTIKTTEFEDKIERLIKYFARDEVAVTFDHHDLSPDGSTEVIDVVVILRNSLCMKARIAFDQGDELKAQHVLPLFVPLP